MSKEESLSEFDGKLLGFIGIHLLTTFLIVITLGIGRPWAVCLKQKWIVCHTIVDGERLTFDGKGIQLFGYQLLWFFFTLLTIGIFAFWIPIKEQKWITKHTHFLDDGETEQII